MADRLPYVLTTDGHCLYLALIISIESTGVRHIIGEELGSWYKDSRCKPSRLATDAAKLNLVLSD